MAAVIIARWRVEAVTKLKAKLVEGPGLKFKLCKEFRRSAL
jgi:hypothetical protein